MLHFKRFTLISLLLISIGVLSVFAYNSNDFEDVTIFMNIRDQSEDYEALFDNANLKKFTIEFEPAVFDQMIENMENHFEIYGDYIDNTIYPIDMTYEDSRGSFEILNVGFRTKSTTSRNLLRTYDWRDRPVYHQTTFQLQFNETFDNPDRSNLYQILKTREVFDLEQLNFEYSQIYQSDYDDAMISEAFTHNLYQEADVLVAKASYAVIYLKIGDTLVNYGFYTLIEPIDSEFLKRHFKSDLALDYGDLYKVTDVMTEGSLDLDYNDYIGVGNDSVRYTYSLRNNTLDGTRRTFEPFEEFVEAINDFDYFKEHYNDIIDIDMFLRYLAISFLVGNSDDIRYNFNNYYLYFDVYTSKVTFIPFDLDNTLGFGKSYDLSGAFMTDYSIYFNLDEPSPLIDNIFAIPELVSKYTDYIEEFINTLFTYQAFEEDFLNAKQLYESILQDEDHLGNKSFDTRNVQWFINTKLTNILDELQ